MNKNLSAGFLLDELYRMNAPQEISYRLENLKGIRERPDYHPEENCYLHIERVVYRALLLKDVNLIWAGIFHDLGKWDYNQISPKTGYPTAPGHDKFGAEMVSKFSNFILNSKIFGIEDEPNLRAIHFVCAQHMRVHQIDNMKPLKRKHLTDSLYWSQLQRFAKLDNMLLTDEEALS
jgi:hypothetical protein